MPIVKLFVDDWETQFRPFVNHIDPNASWQDEDGRGIMFETYGEELEFVLGCNPACVWTYMDDDNGEPTVFSGLHPFQMGVIGYFVTQVAVPEGDEVVVSLH